ncbi:hypothetical protein [Halalkalibacillus halophilus]|uniref:hypothetical protein n=1 Tax=Halalkalibacillus halophilus TaxID=392827 RepID=UPI0004818499|nr:hypothetical protein [Halalkalibacillus halophilus]
MKRFLAAFLTPIILYIPLIPNILISGEYVYLQIFVPIYFIVTFVYIIVGIPVSFIVDHINVGSRILRYTIAATIIGISEKLYAHFSSDYHLLFTSIIFYICVTWVFLLTLKLVELSLSHISNKIENMK